MNLNKSRCGHFINVLEQAWLSLSNEFGWVKKHNWRLVWEPGWYRFSHFWYNRFRSRKSSGYGSRSTSSFLDWSDWDLTRCIDWPPRSLTGYKSGSLCGRVL